MPCRTPTIDVVTAITFFETELGSHKTHQLGKHRTQPFREGKLVIKEAFIVSCCLLSLLAASTLNTNRLSDFEASQPVPPFLSHFCASRSRSSLKITTAPPIIKPNLLFMVCFILTFIPASVYSVSTFKHICLSHLSQAVRYIKCTMIQ